MWEQFCSEHAISTTGDRKNDNDSDVTFRTFFEQTKAGLYVPRNLMVDLEPSTIDNVKNSKYSAIFHPECLLSGDKSADNNFAKGHYSLGKEMIDKVNDRLRKLVDNCDNVQGFVVNHSVGGGTGSGLGALILERIAVDYRKKSKVFEQSTMCFLSLSLSVLCSVTLNAWCFSLYTLSSDLKCIHLRPSQLVSWSRTMPC